MQGRGRKRRSSARSGDSLLPLDKKHRPADMASVSATQQARSDHRAPRKGNRLLQETDTEDDSSSPNNSVPPGPSPSLDQDMSVQQQQQQQPQQLHHHTSDSQSPGSAASPLLLPQGSEASHHELDEFLPKTSSSGGSSVDDIFGAAPPTVRVGPDDNLWLTSKSSQSVDNHVLGPESQDRMSGGEGETGSQRMTSEPHLRGHDSDPLLALETVKPSGDVVPARGIEAGGGSQNQLLDNLNTLHHRYSTVEQRVLSHLQVARSDIGKSFQPFQQRVAMTMQQNRQEFEARLSKIHDRLLSVQRRREVARELAQLVEKLTSD